MSIWFIISKLQASKVTQYFHSRTLYYRLNLVEQSAWTDKKGKNTV